MLTSETLSDRAVRSPAHRRHTSSPAGDVPHDSRLRRGSLRSFAALVLVLCLWGYGSAGAGVLGPGDEQLSSGEYFDRVMFSGAAGDELVIELTSTEFDPYVLVIDGNDNALVQEDDSPGAGLNVRLTFTLPRAGQYTVIVTSALPGESGGYGLSLSAPGQLGARGSAAAPAQQQPQLPAAPAQPGPTAQPQQPSQPARPQQPALPNQPAQPSRPGTVTGTVTDTLGRPIAGARVWIVPALTTGVVELRTDANGNYLAEGLLDVPYRAKAWTFVDYNGEQICLRLGMDSPVDYDTFVPTHGAVRNFRLQLTGPIEDLRDMKEQFGGLLSVFDAWPYEGAGNRIEFTFTPTGPLIDGTMSEPFVRVVDPDRDTMIRGLPIGPYRVEATLVSSDGSRRALNVAPDSYLAYGPAMNLDWTGDGTCGNTTGLDWEYIYLETPE